MSGRDGSGFLLKMVRMVCSAISVLMLVYRLSISIVKRSDCGGTVIERILSMK